LILLAYVASHLLNHAVLLVSIGAADRVLSIVYPFWENLLVTVALYGAFAVHAGLALWALWQRRSLRLAPVEALQYVLGFSIPLLAVEHVMGTRVADSVFGADFGHYLNVLAALWAVRPWMAVVQLGLVIAAWGHAVIGLRFWLRLKPWYSAWQPALQAVALLVPVLAVLGFAEGGKQVLDRIATEPGLFDHIRASAPSPAAAAVMRELIWSLRGLVVAALAAVLALRVLRGLRQRRRGLIRITYPDGRIAAVVRGTTVLEASRIIGVPHASVCGGKGRCSTCRVRVRAAENALPSPLPDEEKVLRRVGAAPGVRLACQLRPRGDVEVTPLLPAFVPARGGLARPNWYQGGEREIAILFADLRAFTQIAELKLPYDVVFLLNRYFAAMGHAVEEAGGRVDKFIGDGVMALFGLETDADAACRAALDAARLMSERLDELNRSLAHELDAPLRIGIGIHAGPVIVGEMGYGRATSLTAVGDAVNAASRLEALCKTYGCELVVSEEVTARAGIALAGFPRREIELRGRRAPLAVVTVRHAAQLASAAGLADASTTAVPEAV
jgi:adenylate cyclase